jgi:SAM-dependent methyltransferase
MKRFPEAEEGNRTHWDELAQAHSHSYDYERLLSGGHLMDEVQVREMGDVAGKSLLHLQCHIGTDTLSWARLGARVTGADISPVSLRVARSLAEKCGLEARFIESSLYDLPSKLNDTFDIVYTSVGVLCWLSDLNEWAGMIRRFLKPEGLFYLMETHPFLCVFDDEAEGLRTRYDYFHHDEPIQWPGDYPDYAGDGYIVRSPSWEWQWSMGDIMNALFGSDLRVEFLHEHNWIPWKALPSMVEGGDGKWMLPKGIDILPLMFSVRAIREGN